MFLQRLNELTQSLREDPKEHLPPLLYQRKVLRYVIELDGQGRLLSRQPDDLADPTQRETRKGLRRDLPDVQRSGKAVRPLLLADNALYTLGLAREDNDLGREAACQEAYLQLLERCERETDQLAIRAILVFLQSTPCKELDLGGEFDHSANITFRVDGVLPIDEGWFQDFWVNANAPGDGPLMQCIVCGQERHVLKRLKGKIKGLPGGQGPGTSLISANENAYESYGLDASLIAPICLVCSERMTKGLNYLLRSERHHIRIGPGAFVFWTRERAEFDALSLLDDPQPEDVRRLIESVFRPKGPRADENRFYAAYLSGSGGRVVVREWLDMALTAAQRNLGTWFDRQEIVDEWGQEHRPRSIYGLASATVRSGKDLPAHTIRSLLLAALAGRPLPTNLLYQAVERTRAENAVSHRHASLIKLVLCSQNPQLEEDTMKELEVNVCHPAYLCGRLFAELEAAQRLANPGAKATITDRFYGTACTAPASVFGTLLQGAQAHLAKLKRDRYPAYAGLQARLEGILSALEVFPKTLTLEEQSRFALGYYHQRAADRAAILEHRREKQASQ